ncbi:MAG TPA: penicillin-binding protein 2 [Nitrolancea sp.]|nr:penicillin-binding protein 2 [Nitrolancea sp.]
MSLMGLMIVVLALFLVADHLGSGGAPLFSGGATPVVGNQPGKPTGTSAGVSSAGTKTPATPTVPNAADLSTPEDVARAYVELWSNSDFVGMYQLLSGTSQQTIKENDFVTRYQDIYAAAGETSLVATMGDAPPDATRIPIHVVWQSAKVGEIQQDNTVTLIHEGSVWKVDWTPSMIFDNLNDGLVRWVPEVPQRGRILDRKGRPLASLGMITEVGIVPGQIKDEASMLQQMSALLDMTQDEIKAKYANSQPDWFEPVRSFPDNIDPNLLAKFNAIPGVEVQKWPDRVYPAGAAAAQVVGYMSQVTADELKTLSKQGYESGDDIGRAGLEAWGEQYLAGKRGGRLVIVGPDGTERSTIAEVKMQPADDIVTTIDLDVQNAAFQSLNGKTGSVVVIDPSDGAILAMASNPSYDPNQFILGMTDQQWAAVNDNTTRPLENRATEVAYPIGSTFKVITMAAGMQSLGLTPQSTYNCPASFSLPGTTQSWHDWSANGQGTLTLYNALVQSCDTVFYQIAAQLDEKGQNLLPDAAKAFGFGTPTGIPELNEVAGTVPDPAWKLANVNDYWARGDAINLSIGQGYFLATPLQVADAYAAIANGGTLWQPYLVQQVKAIDGTVVYSAKTKVKGKLPATAAQLESMRSALHQVTTASNGTAAGLSVTHPFSGETHDVAGKTGTAESSTVDPHAWFAAFSPTEGATMATVAMVEHGGEGGDVAAPIARKVIDAFYAANP